MSNTKALPGSGSISMSQVRAELGDTGSISLGDSIVRGLAAVASGQISMSNLHGKSAVKRVLLERIPIAAQYPSPPNSLDWCAMQVTADLTALHLKPKYDLSTQDFGLNTSNTFSENWSEKTYQNYVLTLVHRRLELVGRMIYCEITVDLYQLQ